MSVVNRMLQDIDRRLGAAGAGIEGLHSSVRSVAPRPAKPRGRFIAAAVASLVIGAAVAATFYDWNAPVEPRAAPSPRIAPVAVAAAPATPPAPTPQPEPQAQPQSQQASESAAMETQTVKPMPTALAQASPDAGVRPQPRLARIDSRGPVESFRMSLELSALPVAKPRPVAAQPRPEEREKPGIPVRSVASEEMVEVARTQWSEGAHEGALATLREALAAAEASQNASAVKSLARELARFEIAANHAQAALEILGRLATMFANDADAMALRANAEQRLGLHVEAARSYLSALGLKPGEGRWMLGAAISLAASGKRDEAQAWVDRARDRGAITPAIAAYLVELGLAVRS